MPTRRPTLVKNDRPTHLSVTPAALAPGPGAPAAAPTPAPAGGNALELLGQLITRSHHPDPAQIQAACDLVLQAGGHRVAPGVFCATLLDLSDRIGRVPAATWLGLCRGIALGATVPGEGALPLPLRHAAKRLMAQLSVPDARKLAMAQALMLDAD